MIAEQISPINGNVLPPTGLLSERRTNIESGLRLAPTLAYLHQVSKQPVSLGTVQEQIRGRPNNENDEYVLVSFFAESQQLQLRVSSGHWHETQRVFFFCERYLMLGTSRLSPLPLKVGYVPGDV